MLMKGTNYGVDFGPYIMLVLGLMLMLVLKSRPMPVLVLMLISIVKAHVDIEDALAKVVVQLLIPLYYKYEHHG